MDNINSFSNLLFIEYIFQELNECSNDPIYAWYFVIFLIHGFLISMVKSMDYFPCYDCN